jgi:hypothetical protein
VPEQGGPQSTERTENVHLYDSEGSFVSRTAKEQIKVRVNLQDLFDKNLLDDMLPELCEYHEALRTKHDPESNIKQIQF